MPRVFGTDGVRGLANREVTAELALDLSVAAARVIIARGDVRPDPRPTVRRGRPGPADLGPDPRARRRGRARLGRGRRAAPAGAADPGRRLPDRRPRRRPGRGHQRLAQPDARQRHQVPRPRRPQARRRRRGRDRGAARQRVGRDRSAPTSAGCAPTSARSRSTSTTCSPRWTARSTGLKVVVDCANGAGHRGRADGAAGRGRRGRGDRRRARRPQHQRRLRLDPPRPRCRRPWSSTAPTPASRSTATPTAAWPSTTRASDVDGDQLLAVLALGLAEAGRLVDDTVVATVMSNLGFVQAMEAAGLRGRADRGRRPLRARGDARRRLRPRRRAVRPRDHEPARHHRRRHPHRAAPARSGWSPPARTCRSLAAVVTRLPQVLVNVTGVDKDRTDDPVLAEAVAAEERGPRRATAGCCCAPPAPSRWSA